MNTKIYLPNDEIQIKNFKKIISDIHLKKVVDYIEKLNIPIEYKEKLFENLFF